MASTIFTDYSTPITASWLNPVNSAIYSAFGFTDSGPFTPAAALANIGGTPLVTYNNFTTALADPTNVSGGAGLVGFTYSLTYSAGSIGAWLKNLATSVGATFIGWIASGTSAVVRTIQDKLRERISALDFGADPTGATDSTAALQAFINALSNSNGKRGYIPGGLYKYTQLYGYYDAALNPGFNQTLQGRLYIEGDGQIIDAEANGWPGAGYTGTVLQSTITTGDCFTISPVGFDGGTYKSRNFTLAKLSLVGNTTGFVLRQAASPWSKIRETTVLQLNATGSGVYWHSAWFTFWENVYVTNVNTTGQTGVGVDFGGSLFAGSFRFSNCVFERFQDGFQVNGNAASGAFIFAGVNTFQSNARDGLQINGAIRSLVIDTPYMEFNGRSHIRCAPAAGSVQSLAIRGGFALGGTTTATSMTDAMIYLRSVTNWSIDGLAVFRPWTDIVNVGYFAANGTVGAISNVCVDSTDNTPPAIVLARVDNQLAMPVMKGNILIGSANVNEFDTTAYMANARLGFGIESVAWMQPVQKTTLALNGTLILQSATAAPMQVLNVTGAGSLVALPGSPGRGRQIVIANQVSSAASTLVRQSDQVTNLVTLTAGQAALCYYEPAAAKWVAVGPIAFTGL